jgi:TRAP-type mannitol/chloroaromatic compound transport system permease large subunit
MENTAVSKYTISFGLSLALCSVVNALLVVTKEKSRTVTSALQRITGHQWATHVVIVLVLFVFFGWLLARANHGQGLKLTANRLTGIILAGIATGGLIITGFYLIAD